MYFAKYKQRVHSQVRGVRDSEKLRACEARGGEPECDPRDWDEGQNRNSKKEWNRKGNQNFRIQCLRIQQ